MRHILFDDDAIREDQEEKQTLSRNSLRLKEAIN